MAGLSVFDLIILFVLGSAAIGGFARGLVQELLSLGALIAALFVLRIAHAPLTLWLSEAMNEGSAAIAAFMLVVVTVWGGGKYAAHRIGSASRKSLIGPADRVLGAGFGLCKGLLIASTAFMLLTLVYDAAFGADSERPAWISESRTYPLMRASSAALSDVLAERIDARDDAGAAAPAAP